jgi:hypothetical protein
VLFERKLSNTSRDQLKELVSQKYDSSKKILNLKRLRSSVNDSLTSFPELSFNNRAFVEEIATIIKHNFREATIIDLSDNDIQTLAGFRCFAQSAPNLKHLSLSNNSLTSISDFDYLSGHKNILLELFLKGNPVLLSTDKYVLHHELVERFPNIKLIDNVAPQSPIKFNLPSTITSAGTPYPVKGNFFDSPSSQGTCANFINRYFQLFDSEDPTHRQKLYGVYTSQSCFSLSIAKGIRVGTTSSIHAQFLKGNRNLHESAQPLAELSHVLSSSSSSSSSSSTEQKSSGETQSFIKMGPLHITYALEQLPKTKHNVKEFVADVFMISVSNSKLLNVCIRGNFLELVSNNVYSFHRVFILTPPSQEQAAHWPALILNDQLTIFQVTPNPGLPSSVTL